MSALNVCLVGNPNCGKSTLFNALTGARQKVGNWPGVTVECKTGYFFNNQQQVNVVDLPGIYQLSLSNTTQAIDERIACEFILQNKCDLIVNIIDATHLERHLYLTLQLLNLNVPVIVAVNMMDIADRRQIKLKLDKLASFLGCSVVGLIANKNKGITELKQKIVSNQNHQPASNPIQYPDSLADAVQVIAEQIKTTHPNWHFCAEWLAQQLLQQTDISEVAISIREQAEVSKLKLEEAFSEELDIVFADIFYTSANKINKQVTSQTSHQKTLTERIDKIVLNRFLGIPIFLAVMYAMFLFAINLGGAFQDFFDISSDAIFVQGFSELLNQMHAPSWLIALLAAGFGRGINTTVTFIPVLGAMFFFLAFLEASGYMARASIVVDRLMRALGLPGKSFVPLIVGFGCNVPAILAARTLENSRDRTLTILMSPFMSCGARLAIFAVFTTAFFPLGGQNIVFLLYFIGICAAILTGLLLKKTILKSELSPLILELPAYHFPSFKSLLLQAGHRLKSFVVRAGRLIVPICMLIGVLNAVNLDGSFNSKVSNSNSLLSSMGRVVTPILSPMGIRQDNWPATVGLVTGILAKEVVVATLNTLYSQEAHLSVSDTESGTILQNLKQGVFSIQKNLMALPSSLTNPLTASAPEQMMNNSVYGVMYEKFSGQVAAFAYLLFVLLYFPCISATAAMTKELNKKWTIFSVAWSTGLAYAAATCFYQVATFTSHPKKSFIWLTAILMFFVFTLSLMKRKSKLRTTPAQINDLANTRILG